MSNVKLNTQTIIADLNEEEIELSEQELILIAGGRMDETKQHLSNATAEVDT